MILLDDQFRDLMSSRKNFRETSIVIGCNASGLLFLGSSTLLTGHTESSCNQKYHFSLVACSNNSNLVNTSLGSYVLG